MCNIISCRDSRERSERLAYQAAENWAEIIAHTCSGRCNDFASHFPHKRSFSNERIAGERENGSVVVVVLIVTSKHKHFSLFLCFAQCGPFCGWYETVNIIIDTVIIKDGLYSFEDLRHLIKSWHKRLEQAANLCEFYEAWSQVRRFDYAWRVWRVWRRSCGRRDFSSFRLRLEWQKDNYKWLWIIAKAYWKCPGSGIAFSCDFNHISAMLEGKTSTWQQQFRDKINRKRILKQLEVFVSTAIRSNFGLFLHKYRGKSLKTFHRCDRKKVK